MTRKVEGKVKQSTVNHYKDCTADTYIKLESGEEIVYSHVAPLPQGHNISATGIQKTLAEVMVELHPNFFRLEDGTLVYVMPVVAVEGKDLQTMVLKADQIEDKDNGITYKERY